MPKSELHRRQRKKNLTMLVILLALVGVFFSITMLKVSGA